MRQKVLIAGQEGMVGSAVYNLFKKKKKLKLSIVKEKILILHLKNK